MKPSRLLPLLFALLKFVSGFVLASRAYELHRDEYLYLEQGRHLAWGYLEVPPLIAAQAWVTQALGGGYFWVKFWPFLWGALTVYVVGRAVQRLGGRWFAVALASVSYGATAYARLNFLFQPNSFEVFGFTLCCYWLLRYENLGFTRWEDGQMHPLPQDYADMVGWQELADKTYQAYQALPDSTRPFTLIKCDNYGQASAINYYNRHRVLPMANSFNGSYLFWFPPRPARPYRHLLLIGEGSPADLVSHFRELRQVGEITNPYAREKGTTILLGTDPDVALIDQAYREHRAALATWVREP